MYLKRIMLWLRLRRRVNHIFDRSICLLILTIFNDCYQQIFWLDFILYIKLLIHLKFSINFENKSKICWWNYNKNQQKLFFLLLKSIIKLYFNFISKLKWNLFHIYFQLAWNQLATWLSCLIDYTCHTSL